LKIEEIFQKHCGELKREELAEVTDIVELNLIEPPIGKGNSALVYAGMHERERGEGRGEKEEERGEREEGRGERRGRINF
jgi:hypothetical protein